MNVNDYRKAMDHIVPNQELKERIMHKEASQKRCQKRYVPVHPILASTLTAALLLVCAASVALAASPDLRMAVLSFFRIEEREQIPGRTNVDQTNVDQPGGSPSDKGQTDGSKAGMSQPDEGQPGSSQVEISHAEIGNLVKAQYVMMDQNYGCSGDLLNDLTWSEDRRTLLEAKFWEIQDNQMIPVQVDMQTRQIDVTFQGIRYQGNLYWFLRNGELYLFQGSPHSIDTRPEDEWYVETIPGHTDVLLLKLSQGRQMDYNEYPMIYHLDTGETEDFLASTGADQLERAYDYLWSEDMRRALILCSVGADGFQEWLCDLDAQTLVRLDDLTGLAEDVSASFAGNDTLILTTHTASKEDGTWQTVTGYAYDVPTGQKTKTLGETQYYRWWEEEPYGAQLFGGRCILIGQDGQVRLVDLKTGTQTMIEGFTYRKGNRFLPSPSGNKLLYYASDSNAEGLGIVQLGVADLEKGTFIAFEREGYGDLYEEGIGWNDDSTVGIRARSSDGETRYIILYTF